MTLTESSTPILQSRFRQVFGDAGEVRVALAPGRVNLIGEHTDYNDGFVLPMAIDRYVAIAFRARGDRRIRAHATAFGETEEIDVESLAPPGERRWESYVAGVAWAMIESGLEPCGIDCVIQGDLPLGGGLSSSAALEMATARALCEASGISWSAQAMARLGQRAENDYVGVACGLMDQLVSAASEEGCALLLDCRTLETEPVSLPADTRVVVMDTGARRSLTGSAYNERRASCEAAVEAVQSLEPEVRALRDVDLSRLEAARHLMGEVAFRRARHVVEENARPAAMAAALRGGRLHEAGRLMDDSHASLRDLYEVSSDELDLMADLARRHPACFGARLTGAGFGGCAVALVAADGAASFAEEVGAAYRARVDLPSELFVCSPVGGARILESAVIDDRKTAAASEGVNL